MIYYFVDQLCPYYRVIYDMNDLRKAFTDFKILVINESGTS